MSVPFSNSHLRVPRGFGTILEGLTREILRDQPEDIPAYAASYFEVLLKQREDSGLDPAEWAARLEDRFYNNHAFKTTGTGAEKETSPEEMISKEKPCKFQTEDESSLSEDASSPSTTQAHVSEKPNSPESTDDEEKYRNTEMPTISAAIGISESMPVVDTQSDELSCTDENIPNMTTVDEVDRPGNETDGEETPEGIMPQSDSDVAGLLSSRGISNLDVCAQELGEAKDEENDQQGSVLVDEETKHSEEEENTEDAEPVESFLQSGLADVDVCATELGGTGRVMEGDIVQDNAHVIEEEEIVKPPLEESVELSFSQLETTQGNQQEAEDQAQNIKEEKTTVAEVSNEETNEGLAHNEGSLDDNVIPKEDSLVEISFEDVPEAQGIIAVGEKEPELETSLVLLNNILDSQEREESKEFPGSSTDQNIPDAKDEIKVVENEVNSEEQQMKSQHEGFDLIKEEMETNNIDLNNDENDETDECVKSVSTSGLVTTEAAKEIQEEKTDNNEDTENMGEGKYDQNQEFEKDTQSNDADFKNDMVAEMDGGDEEGIRTESYSELEDQEFNHGKVEPNPSQVTQLNASVAGMEEESEAFEESTQHLAQENEETQKTISVPQPEEITEEMTDSEKQEKSAVMDEEETTSLTHSAYHVDADHQEEERPPESEKESSQLSSKSDEEECNRPQEEEDIMDIPLDDPEANRAAAKIQAGFRGHMTRKKLKPEDKTEGEEVSSSGEVLNGNQGVSEAGRSGAVERDDTSVPEQ